MKSKLMTGVAALAFVAAATAAKADVSFSFTFSGLSYGTIFTGTGTGVASGDDTPYTITSVSGVFKNGDFPDRIVTGVTTNYLTPDNKFISATAPIVSQNGISFLTDVEGSALNIKYVDGQYKFFSEEAARLFKYDGQVGVATTATVTFAPLGAAAPGALAGAGLIPLLGFAGAWFARRRHQKLAA